MANEPTVDFLICIAAVHIHMSCRLSQLAIRRLGTIRRTELCYR